MTAVFLFFQPSRRVFGSKPWGISHHPLGVSYHRMTLPLWMIKWYRYSMRSMINFKIPRLLTLWKFCETRRSLSRSTMTIYMSLLAWLHVSYKKVTCWVFFFVITPMEYRMIRMKLTQTYSLYHVKLLS